jgi:exodeoxyribonuclease VIII
MKTGKFDNISLKEYHKLPGWSKTYLDKIDKSPAHYLEWIKNPPEQTPAMAFGAALHCAVLTPELYKKQYALLPKIDKHSNDGKAAWKKFQEENDGKDFVEAEDAGRIERISQAIFAHPLASQLLSNGEAEQSFFWIDPKTGLECKARPDYLRNDAICIDLKSCSDAKFKPFQRSVYNYRYHVQGSFFMDGIFQATKMQCSDFVLIAVETETPFGIMVYRLDDLAIDTGRVAYQDNLLEIKQWEEHPEAYETVYQLSQSPIEMPLPAWAE